MFRKIEIKNVLLVILLLDIMIIGLHLFLGKENYFFNLDKEYNLPSFYSAAKLVSVGILAVIVFLKIRKLKMVSKWQEIYSWFAFGALFIYLGFDEFFTIHEKTIGYLEPKSLTNLEWFSNHVFYWVPLFLPFIILALILFYYFVRRILTTSSLSRNLFIAGAIFFALVIVSEFIGGFLDGGVGYVVMTLEESFEIFGASSFFAGIFVYLKKVAKKE